MFDYAFSHTIGEEGGLSNHPDDHGGMTKFGVTHAVWRAYCAESRPLDIRGVSEITLDDAKGVYANLYWAPLNLDMIRDAEVAAEIFDTGVNCGIVAAAKMAQRAFNLLRLAGMPDLSVDGRMGPVTRQALNSLIDKGYRRALLAALNAYQAIYYIEIVERNPSQRAFIRGWMKRTLVNAQEK